MTVRSLFQYQRIQRFKRAGIIGRANLLDPMQTDWNKFQSHSIDWLRFPMAVAVVVLHHGTRLIQDASGPQRALCILFQEGICRLAVPCFFFISGYLFFSKLQQWDWGVWKAKIQRRAKTLLLPYILWNLIAFLAYWGYSAIRGDGLGFQQSFTQCGGIRMFWATNGGLPIGVHASPIDGPLWFIRDLILYTLFTPLIFKFLKWTKNYGLLALVLFFLLVPGYIPEGFVFYMTGAWLQLKQKNVVELAWSQRKFLYVISLALLAGMYFVFGNEYWHRFLKVFFLFAGIGASFCGTAALIQQGRIRVRPFLARSSFFLFATHEILILHDIAQPLVDAILPSTGKFWPCVEFFLVPALATGICLGLLWLMERLIPRTTGLLTGNRKIQTA